MIPLLILRNGILTWNPALQSFDSQWQYTPLTLEQQYVPQGLLFAVERGAFGILKEELLRDKPRAPNDPRNSCSATGFMVGPNEKLYVVSWKNIDGEGYRLLISSYHEHSGLAITVSGDGDEIASVIMNERPEWTNEQVGELTTELLLDFSYTCVGYLPHTTKSVKELAEWHRNHTAQLSEASK